jgi:rSAM/selenodomain-associated transferase 2
LYSDDRLQPDLSVVIPTWNEEQALPATLDALARLKPRPEIIVVDGGSSDRTIEVARQREARVVGSVRGRGTQLQAGARIAKGRVLWFLHADTQAPEDATASIEEALRQPAVAGGNFRLVFSGASQSARVMTRIYPHLRRLGLVYGDSGIFVRREVYDLLGGFQPYPLFEDLDFVRRLRKQGRFVHLNASLVTSSRRFEGRNFAVTFLRWTALQSFYWMGVSPRVLARFYEPVRKPATP